MVRLYRLCFLAGAMVLGGLAPAQGPKVADILTLETAGQPTRQVKVLKTTRGKDGHPVTELKDVKTGEVIMLKDMKFTAMTNSADSKLPNAKSRECDPLLPLDRLVSTPPKPLITSAPKTLPHVATVTQATVSTPKVLPAAIATVVKSQTTFPMPMTPTQLVSNTVSPGRVTANDIMRQDISQYVRELNTALRPTVRMDAATALSECRYASRQEVKQVLVKAVTTDEAALVRAHCIMCLSKLGYAEVGYVKTLETLRSQQSHPDVRLAAGEALRQLLPK